MSTKSRGWAVNVALLIASTILAVLFIEVALRLAGHSPLYVSPERDRFWSYDPMLGWAHQPGQEGIFETQQFRTSVRINQRGLRDREHTYERTAAAARILILGDSFAWGYGVEESERFSQLLESSLGLEVINAGVSGYSTDQELIWLKDEGVKYDIDLVVVVVSGNDIGDNLRHLVSTIYYKPYYVNEGGRLILQGTPVPRTNLQGRIVYSISQRSALAFFLVQRYFDLRADFGSPGGQSAGSKVAEWEANSTGEPFALTLALLDEMRSIADSRGARFVIVTTDGWWNGPAGATYPEFVETLKNDDFVVLDVPAALGFEANDMLIADDGHWNRLGHEFVAAQLEALIENNDLLNRS